MDMLFFCDSLTFCYQQIQIQGSGLEKHLK